MNRMRTFFQLQILLFFGILMNTITTGSSLSVHIGDDAEIKWTLNPVPKADTNVIIKHQEQVVCLVKGTVGVSANVYKDRVEFTGNATAGDITFTLLNVTTLDAGVYSALYDGTTYNGLTLVIYVKPGIPSITDKVPVVGMNLSLECSSQSNSLPDGHSLDMTYTWLKDGRSLPGGGKYIATGKALTIINVQKSDKGSSITCQAEETQKLPSDISPPLIIDPEYKPDLVSFVPNDTRYHLLVGTRLGPVTCTADCKPACSYRWTHNATLVSDNAFLNISKIQKRMKGNYTCLASNTHGRRTSTSVLTLVVEFGPESVALNPVTTSYKRKQGARLGPIVCDAKCEPACSYQWSRSGNNISPASNTLDIPSIQRNQTGVYTCTASNKYDTMTVSVKIVVEFGPLNILLNPNARYEKPVQGTRLGPVNCSAECEPACEYQWSHDGNNIVPASSVLDITRIQRGQTGTYTCTATNRHGTKTVNVTVTVKFSPIILHLKPAGQDIDENRTVHFVCETEGYPVPTVTIYFERNSTVYKQDKNLSTTLMLENVNCLLTGYYFCNAINEVGNITFNSSVNVLCSPRLDYRKKIETDHGLGNGENLNITGSFIANPPPTFTWRFRRNDSQIGMVLKNGTESFYYINQQNDYISYSSRAIQNVTGEEHFGQYVLEASNTKGSASMVQRVFSRREPNPPVLHKAVCISSSEASITWISGFNGGDAQHFVLGHKSLRSAIYDRSVTYSDPGKAEKRTETLSELHADTLYFFKVYAENKFGNSSSSENLNCTTFKIIKESSPGNTAALTGGAVGGSVFALINIAVVAVVIYKRKQPKNKGDDHELMDKHGALEGDDPEDGMKPNIIYESAGSNYDQEKTNSNNKYLYAEVNKKIGSASKGQPTDVYAEVKSPKKEEDSTTNIYAEVTKKGQKAEKGKKQTKSKAGKKDEKKDKKIEHNKKDPGMVYENVEGNLAQEKEDVYEKAPQMDKETNGKLSRKKNKDGLVYIDVVIRDTGKMQKGVIHGIENRNNYAEVDFTRHAEPLPSDDEENEAIVSPSNEEN